MVDFLLHVCVHNKVHVYLNIYTHVHTYYIMFVLSVEYICVMYVQY